MVKASSGNLLALTCTNLNSQTRYLQFFNNGSGTTTGTPDKVYPVFGNGFLVVGTEILSTMGVEFDTGITFGFSTTPGTYTAGVAGDCYLDVYHN